MTRCSYRTKVLTIFKQAMKEYLSLLLIWVSLNCFCYIHTFLFSYVWSWLCFVAVSWLSCCGLNCWFNMWESWHCTLELLVATLISYSIPERAVQFGWVTRDISELTSLVSLQAPGLFAAAEAEQSVNCIWNQNCMHQVRLKLVGLLCLVFCKCHDPGTVFFFREWKNVKDLRERYF